MNCCRMFAAVEAGIKRLRLKLQIDGVLLQLIELERFVVLKQNIVVLPVFVLLACAPGSLSGFLRLRVDMGQREIFKNNFDLVLVGFLDFFEFSLNSCAVWSLIVRELDQSDRSIGWSF